MRRIAWSPGDLFLSGKYRLEKKLGEGGMGQVWAATELYSGNTAALKLLHHQGGNFALRFRQECRFHTKLRHPNIVRMAQAGEDENGVMYILMDLLEGVTARQMLQRARRLDVGMALHLAIQLADACAYVHDKGIWHRDLKPENLMVGTKDEGRGHLWLFDFGIAKFANIKERGLISDEMPSVASVRYMAPERVDPKNRDGVDGRADIYAFGGVLYELITGRHIFIKEDEPAPASQVMHGHLVAEVEPIQRFVPECPEAVWTIVAGCLAKNPESRVQRFDEVAQALRAVIRAAGPRPPEELIERRIEQERMRAARELAFAKMDLEPRSSGEEASDEDETRDDVTVPGKVAGAAIEELIRKAKAREAEEVAAAARARASREGTQVGSSTAPMMAGVVPPARVLPFEPVKPPLGLEQTGKLSPEAPVPAAPAPDSRSNYARTGPLPPGRYGVVPVAPPALLEATAPLPVGPPLPVAVAPAPPAPLPRSRSQSHSYLAALVVGLAGVLMATALLFALRSRIALVLGPATAATAIASAAPAVTASAAEKAKR